MLVPSCKPECTASVPDSTAESASRCGARLRRLVLRLPGPAAAEHAETAVASETDWTEIVGLYDVLRRADPSPIVELNRAAAIAMRDGPAAGLRLIDALLDRGDLADYHIAHSARADLCRRLGRIEDARQSYARALSLVRQEPERRYLERRLRALSP